MFCIRRSVRLGSKGNHDHSVRTPCIPCNCAYPSLLERVSSLVVSALVRMLQDGSSNPKHGSFGFPLNFNSDFQITKALDHSY
ncbi:hypothetical protein VNO77_33844 [Canavalia gladiata]|uniref:Uncharacterized protein n=1 Tax=Canavalia gladiata TaxID=3824 RepID=A0AAN9PZA7_CANGL